MKTISTKPNPAFKLAQPLPVTPTTPPPPTDGAAVGISALTPPKGDLCRRMTNLAVCAMSVSQGLNAPAVRLPG